MEFVPTPEPSPFGPAGDPVTRDPLVEPAIDAAAASSLEAPLVAVAATEPRSRPGAVRRTVATLVLAVGLLIVGGVSAVWAASPDPSAATTPSTTTPSTTPDGSGTPGTGGTTHPKGDCPNMGGSPSGTNGSTSSPSTSG